MERGGGDEYLEKKVGDCMGWAPIESRGRDGARLSLVSSRDLER